jgi:D-3-phosphoglycerate dehydrogenase
VLVWSRRFATGAGDVSDITNRPVPITVVDSPETLAARSDVLSVHLALAKDTAGLVGRGVLGFLRPGAYVVNTARAEVVDADALADAVRTRGIRAALDVFADEPAAGSGAFTPPLAQLPGVYGTHHIGASTEQAQLAIADETVRIVLAYLRTGEVPNVVNLATTTPATHLLVVRHHDRPGVLAQVFDQLREAGINVQETSNTIFAGADAAVARIQLDSPPPAVMLERLSSGHPDIIDLTVVPL